MELEELREQINGIDEELLSLFTRRMSLAGQVARYKQEHGLPIFQQERERQILRRVLCGSRPVGGNLQRK